MSKMMVDTRLKVASEYTRHHAASLLNEHPRLRQLVMDRLTGPVTLEAKERRQRHNRYLGVTADSLNTALKFRFGETGDWQFEATVRDGVVFGSSDHLARIEGFDIARFDERANLARLWSVCFGRRTLADGKTIWDRYLFSRPHLREIAVELEASGQPGRDLRIDPASPTILGEIQFGNWALAHRDIMKLLAAVAELEVDLFVYITADGHLADMISDGTVNFSKTKEILTDYASVVTVPTWLVGIDFEEGHIPTLDSVTQPSV
jgi:hypothetical protein